MTKFDRALTSLSLFVESPDYFEGGLFHTEMNDEQYNKFALLQLLPKLKELDLFDNRQVFVKDHQYYGPENKTFYLVKEKLLDGAIEIETKKDINFCLGVWQRNNTSNKGLMRNFFINYLPKFYETIVSGKIANKYGMQFWKKLLTYFVENNKKVTVLNGPDNEGPYDSLKFEDYWTHVKQDKQTAPTFADGSNKLFKFYLR